MPIVAVISLKKILFAESNVIQDGKVAIRVT
jgi:hypothetical protein